MRISSLIVPAIFVAVVLALAGGNSARAAQPVSLWLPWEGGSLWTYTQGPHGDYAEALDFQPPDAGGRGCNFISSFWATAAADGTVATRANGVEIDHGDGFSTGYYHLGNVQVTDGQKVVAGDHLGNPGCCPDGQVEGCWATGPHLHFYTTYKGTRQPIAGVNLGGWLVQGDGCLSRTTELVCSDSRIVSNSPDPVGASGPADIVVLLDTSWSVALDPNDADRSDVAVALLQAARDEDRVSVINFNTRIKTRSPLRTVGSNGQLDSVLASAIETGADFGRTDMRLALRAACRELLNHGESNARAVIVVSDGRDTVGKAEGAEACLSHHGIPVFAYRLGDDPAPLLARIAENTGGKYMPLADVRNLYCEFRQVRAQIKGDPPGRCSAIRIEPGDMLSLPFNIPAGQDGATLEIRWRQRTVQTAEENTATLKATIRAPSRVSLPTPYPGIVVKQDAGSTTFEIARPINGTWSLSVSGDNLPEGGVYVTFSGSTIPQAPPPRPESTPEPTEEPTAGPTDPPSETPEGTPDPTPSSTNSPEPTAAPTPTPDPRPTPTPAPRKTPTPAG